MQSTMAKGRRFDESTQAAKGLALWGGQSAKNGNESEGAAKPKLTGRLRAVVFLCIGLAACSASGTDVERPRHRADAGSEGRIDDWVDDAGVEDAGVLIPDPKTCEEAALSRTYQGCDFWPTVTDNIVRPIFDFAVVVANTSDEIAEVQVMRQGAIVVTEVVPPQGLTKIYLPWVEELKSLTWMPGQPDNGCPTWVKTSSVKAVGGAYHLRSSRPVAVYQFNAIEYAGKGGRPGKTWASCDVNDCFGQQDCFSYTNDASLLLPSTALTENYRIFGPSAWKDTTADNGNGFTFPPYFAVTGTRDGTSVTVKTSPKGAIAGGGGVPATPGGGTATFSLDAGDVVLVVGTETSDFSGTLVTATAPVQIVTGIACSQIPHGVVACDHLEETVLPVETLGKHYFVTRPTGPSGSPARHLVRIYGNVDGTQLTYPNGNPGGPSVIDAGQMIELPNVGQDFEIVADNEILVASFQHGAGPLTGDRQGDPSLSFMASVEQYRKTYVFLAPDDYETNYADIVAPLDAELVLDGAPVTVAPTPLGSGYGVVRLPLGAGNRGAHVLEASAPVGLQVMGYGAYTSYQYPGGLNLGKIAPPPVK